MTVDESTFDGFFELFEGRDDAVLIDPPKQVKLPEDRPGQDLMGIENYVSKHLEYNQNIGIYPITPDSEVRWICTDLDDEDAENEAWDLYAAWEYYGIQAWVETSRSKGYHVWVFLDEPIPAVKARRAGLWIHGMAKVEPKELNPKQELLGEGEYGNCVRLPYPKKQHGSYRQCMWRADRTTPIALEQFVEEALDMRTDGDVIARLAAMWTPPPVIVSDARANPQDRENWNGEAKFFAKDVFMDEEVMIPEGQRDNTFWVLANYMYVREYPKREAIGYVKEIWNNQLEDQTGYPLETALAKVDRVYRNGVKPLR